jgi:molybdopterin biosynthesis enzyme
LGKIIHLCSKPKPLHLGDRKENFNKRFESIERKKQAIEEMKKTSDLIVTFGASAVSDENDAIPEAIRLRGGRVERTGMPVDPGNLLVLGELDGRRWSGYRFNVPV